MVINNCIRYLTRIDVPRATGKISSAAGSTAGRVKSAMPLSFVGAERGAKEWQIAQRDEN